MRNLFASIRATVSIIAILVFISGLVFVLLGVFDLILAFTHFGEELHSVGGLIAIGLLHSVDLFLIAIVFFVLSLGMVLLFNDHETILANYPLPEWLRVKNFIQLKIILWEAILTTLVISYLAGLSERKIKGVELDIQILYVPAAILIIAISLFFLKKEGKH